VAKSGPDYRAATVRSARAITQASAWAACDHHGSAVINRAQTYESARAQLGSHRDLIELLACKTNHQHTVGVATPMHMIAPVSAAQKCRVRREQHPHDAGESCRQRSDDDKGSLHDWKLMTIRR